ncbi:hypothetical protein C8J44_2347 [Sphingomonas sp. PP-CE-3A-406]|uniref:hypothetical protein n=1 Tax=Sphingomonas sp. PP-CE-3A-406 TaxID=2135659 RepID=UPI000F25507C|nr:hypothetical protein [Sphingomonas sp. PP-CE-3A-406]RMB54721.1 hypothetical protein C8J44_2347 [Sphingomonas sp. PP-CE-3A-406]
MKNKASVCTRVILGITIAAAAIGAHAQFVPSAGYSSGGSRPGAAVPSDPSAPPLTRIPDRALWSLIHVDPLYMRGSAVGHAEVVGAFAIAETSKAHVVAAWSPGFLPVTLSLSDGRCYILQADYEGGTLSNGRLSKSGCEGQRKSDEPSPPPPPGRSLRFIGTAWGYGAWADDRAKTTIITAPGATTFQPLFTAQMTSTAIMAMNSPDSPGGNVTLVGKIKGQLTVVTLEVGY